jgi:hypothetical protein
MLPHRDALAQLPDALGQRGCAWIARVCVNDAARAALERSASGDRSGSRDLGLARYCHARPCRRRAGWQYYTGILFEGFVHGLGFAVVSGGRYDNLIAHFGPLDSCSRFCHRSRARDDDPTRAREHRAGRCHRTGVRRACGRRRARVVAVVEVDVLNRAKDDALRRLCTCARRARNLVARWTRGVNLG